MSHPPTPPITLPRGFRRLPPAERRAALADALGCELPPGLTGDAETAAVADLLIENSAGTFPVPLGLATGFRVDGEDLVIPLATEEASVVAAASYAARLLADGNESGERGLGIRTEADPPIGTVQLFLEETRDDAEVAVSAARAEIAAAVDGAVATLVDRGGGFRGLTVTWLGDTLKVEIDLDVRDAMGANKVNTAGEAARPLLERLTGGRLLMAIVTNASRRALVRASGQVPCARLARGGYSGAEVAQRIVRATEIAAADHDRAVTHNKGVLNGIAALTLATGNDTRAVEAAAHGWAASGAGSSGFDGTGHGTGQGTGPGQGPGGPRYAPLTRYHVADGFLHARLECPLPLGTVGGAIDVHPVSRLALRILGNPDSRRLAAIAAAVGLAQNLAALRALVTEGIQHGHMRLHAERLAFNAGARGTEVSAVAIALAEAAQMDLTAARRLLAAQRASAGRAP